MRKSLIIYCSLISAAMLIAGAIFIRKTKEITTDIKMPSRETVSILVPIAIHTSVGKNIYHGIEQAVDEYGGTVGNYDIKLSVVDVGYDNDTERIDNPERALLVAHAADDPSVAVVVGPIAGDINYKIMPEMNKRELSVLAYSAAYPGFTVPDYGGYGEYEKLFPSGKHTFFTFVPNNIRQGFATAIFAMQNSGTKFMIISEESLFSTTATKEVARFLEEYSVSEIEFRTTPESVDATQEILNDIVSLGIDGIIVLALPTKKISAFLHSVRENGYKDDIIGLSFRSFISPEVDYGNISMYSIDPLPYPDRLPNKVAMDFLSRYRAKYDTDPIPYAFAAHEVTHLALKVIASCGNDRECIWRELSTIRSFYTAYGVLRFEQYGYSPSKTLQVSKFVKGKWSFVKMLEL